MLSFSHETEGSDGNKHVGNILDFQENHQRHEHIKSHMQALNYRGNTTNF